MPSPMPLVDPVTSATLPFRLMSVFPVMSAQPIASAGRGDTKHQRVTSNRVPQASTYRVMEAPQRRQRDMTVTACPSRTLRSCASTHAWKSSNRMPDHGCRNDACTGRKRLTAESEWRPEGCTHIALVLQGGGALGAYQGWRLSGAARGGVGARLGRRRLDRRHQLRDHRGQPAGTAGRTAARVLGADHVARDLISHPSMATRNARHATAGRRR